MRYTRLAITHSSTLQVDSTGIVDGTECVCNRVYMSCAYTRADIYWVPVHRVVPFACSVTYGTGLISIPCEQREITIVRAFRIGSLLSGNSAR